jgi:hypothetical protein
VNAGDYSVRILEFRSINPGNIRRIPPKGKRIIAQQDYSDQQNVKKCQKRRVLIGSPSYLPL